MTEPIRILIVEDLPTDAELAEREIKQALESCLFRRVETRPDYLAALEEFKPDLIVSDYHMPHFDGLTALKLVLEHDPLIPLIILTGAINEDTAVECMKAGAADYVIKEHIKRLGQAVIHALGEKKVRQERRKAEEALRESEARFRGLYENATVGLYRITPDGRILMANPAAVQMLGYDSFDELVQRNLELEGFDLSSRSEFHHQMERDGVVTGFESSWTKKDGTTIFVLESAKAVRNEQGQILYYDGIFEDITERKQAEAAQAELEEQLRQAQKLESIGRLAGGIAHDFNNLLVPIIGYAELGQGQLSPDSELYAHLQKIKIAADRAASLTRQILAFSRRQMLEIQELNLNEIIADFEEMLRRLIGEDIELQILLTSTPCQVKADRAQIEQILLNLSVNARDAMPTGGKLTIKTDRVILNDVCVQEYPEILPGTYVMLALSDTGHGMDTETQKQIFEPFFTTKEKGKGTGLGLATVFGIVKQHQGHIWVYSEPGTGTTFKICLPESEEAAQTVANATSEPKSVYGTETVLVVEDESTVRKLVCETLASYGYAVIEAKSPNKALQFVATYEGTIHLLLTDVIMPNMNGRELYEKLAIDRPDLKVLYMSGYTDDVIVHHGVLDEKISFLQKPFTIPNLTQKIRRVLD